MWLGLAFGLCVCVMVLLLCVFCLFVFWFVFLFSVACSAVVASCFVLFCLWLSCFVSCAGLGFVEREIGGDCYLSLHLISGA